MKKIVLIGNPNTGKTSLFNTFTGLNQSTGNYPGITVDKKTGYFTLDQIKYELVDLPGTYSLEPHSLDEEIVLQELISNKIDAVIYIADATNLRRNLFLFSQIKDLGYPCLLVINRIDKLNKSGLKVNFKQLAKEYKTSVIPISVKKSIGIDELKKELVELNYHTDYQTSFTWEHNDISEIAQINSVKNLYWAWLIANQKCTLKLFNETDKKHIISAVKNSQVNSESILKKEATQRYAKIDTLLEKAVIRTNEDHSLSRRIDKIITHKHYGYLIFFAVLFLIFQAIFSWASIPMDFIDSSFGRLSAWLGENLPQNRFSQLISEGIIPGIGGVIIFIPQIAILFGFISILEQSGYMSRVVFIMDKFMRRFGLNGKSIIPLISGIACSIPAIMAARNIENPKERLLTILVTPFMTCSARLPVYTILIALMVPNEHYYGFNLQGVILMGMYLLGFISSVMASVILNKFIYHESTKHFIIEMPGYQWPQINNLLHTLISKIKTFVFEAGKIIVAVSIILWVLASFGPSKTFDNAEQIVKENYTGLSELNFEDELTSYKLEHSYLGYIGKGIEPLVKPLGYDWKIGIGIISSFAAREVFVGTMASLYSVGSKQDDTKTILQSLKSAKNHETGEPVYTLAVSLSLLMFYAFAMQCVSTIAIVKRETNSWKWPIIQTIGMTTIAYIVAFLTFNIFS